jgi:hypothetical protein
MRQPVRSTTPLFHSTLLTFTMTLLFVILSAPFIFARPSDPLRYHGGIRNSQGPRKLNAKQQTIVLRSLREKTGLVELDFDEDGFLRAGDPTHFSGGSATARALLLAALESEQAFDLESHHCSLQVAFARIAAPISYHSNLTGASIDVIPVELDFGDFDRLRGDRQAISAFDLGIVMLHELAHGVLRLLDARTETDALGECEAHINQIRRELGLPERQHYIARLIELPRSTGGGSIKHAELLFVRISLEQGRVRRKAFTLTWEAAQVGQILSEEAIARSRTGTIAMQ